jgi:ABC-type multidrug transport system ATPase subunit
MPVVQIKSITRAFKETTALNDISFSIEKAKIFGVIGPDGAGKTTLFRIIASLLLPDSGNASVCGYDTVKQHKEVRKLIGYMPGRFSLYHDLTVSENLNFYATVFGTTVRENYDLIRDIYKQIEPFSQRRAGALSGGMKQKLALSCALIHKPELLILDEPTTGVDAVSRKEFWDMLHKIRNEGITILVSTPYMDEALKCDEVALVQKGKILSQSKPAEISSFFRTPLYSVKSGSSNFRLLNELRMKDWCKSAWLFGQEVHVGVNEGKSEGEIEEEFRNSQDIKEFRRIEPGIEDTFIDLMDRN